MKQLQDARKSVLTFMMVLGGGCATAGAPATLGSGTAPDGLASRLEPYRAWVTSESADQVALIEFDGRTARVAHRRGVGSMPVEMDGPHGVAVSPDGRFIYVSIGHGVPFGWLWKIDVETDQLVGRTMLGHFPATVAVTPDGEFGFVSNFNLHGDPVPSSISKVHLETMVEVARIETCTMPHGSRVNPQGTRHYSVCMMDEVLVEIDTGTGEVLRTLELGDPDLHGDTARVAPPATPQGPPGRGGADHGHSAAAAAPACSPTWAEPSADGRSVFVTCNRAREAVEVDVAAWRVVRRFGTGENPYNIGVTPDGRLMLVTLRNRTDPALEIYDLESGRQIGRVATSTTLVHGVAATDDSRFAFVSAEGVGAEPGRVDVVDLRAFRRVATAEVGQQATGIAAVPMRR